MTPADSPPISIRVDDVTLTADARSIRQMLALETHSTPWRPAGAMLARLIDVAIVGIPTGSMSRHDVGASLQMICASSHLYRLAIRSGHPASAISAASFTVAELEKLAAAGSEDATAALLIAGQMYHQDGIAQAAFAAARTYVEAHQV